MRSWSSPAEGHEGDTTPTLFELGEARASVDPVTAWRRAEAELRRLRAEDAADQREVDEIYVDCLGAHHSTTYEEHPERGEDCPWCRIEARGPRVRELEREVAELGEAALKAVRRAEG